MRIRFQLTAAVFAAGSVGIAGLLVNRSVVSREAIFGRLESRAQALSDIVKETALPQLRKGSREGLERQVSPLCRWPSLTYLGIWDAGGAGESPLFQYTRPGGRTAGTPDGRAFGARDGIYDLSFNIEDSEGVAGTVRMGISMEGIRSDLSRIAREGTAFGAAAIVLLALASWYVGILLGKKLESLVEAVEDIGNGELPRLPEEGSQSEVGRLSRAFRILNARLLAEERRRKDVETLKDDLTNMLVHDFKHPITVFKATLVVMEEGMAGGIDVGRALAAMRMAKKNVERLNAMVEDILQLARLHSSTVPVQRRRISVKTLLEACAEDAALIAKDSDRPWNISMAPGAVSRFLYGDRALLQRLIGNLVLNAIDHSQPGAAITLGARLSDRDRAKVELFVANEGTGLSSEAVRQVFQKYRTTEESARNVGLGLAFCKIVADCHSGKLEARSAKDHSIEFALVLPVLEGGAPKPGDADQKGAPAEAVGQGA